MDSVIIAVDHDMRPSQINSYRIDMSEMLYQYNSMNSLFFRKPLKTVLEGGLKKLIKGLTFAVHDYHLELHVFKP